MTRTDTLILPAPLRRPAPRTLTCDDARALAEQLLADSYGAQRDDIEALARWALERALDQEQLEVAQRDAENVRRQADFDLANARDAHAATHAVLEAARDAQRDLAAELQQLRDLLAEERNRHQVTVLQLEAITDELQALRVKHAEVCAERELLSRHVDECICGAADAFETTVIADLQEGHVM